MDIFFGIIKVIYYLLVIPFGLYAFFTVTKQEKEQGVERSFAGSWIVVGTSYFFCAVFIIMSIPATIMVVEEGNLLGMYRFITIAIGYALYYHSYKVFDKEATQAARAEWNTDLTDASKIPDKGYSYTETTYADGSRSNDKVVRMLTYNATKAGAPLVARIMLFVIGIVYAPYMCYFNLLRFYGIVLYLQWKEKLQKSSTDKEEG